MKPAHFRAISQPNSTAILPLIGDSTCKASPLQLAIRYSALVRASLIIHPPRYQKYFQSGNARNCNLPDRRAQ